MKGAFSLMPGAGYGLKAFAVDRGRNDVYACAEFKGTFTGQGGANGETMNTDYAYVIEFEGDKIRHLTKIWSSTYAMKQIGRP